MFRLFFAIALFANSAAYASETYTVDGEVRGFFCHYFGFVCNFKHIDAESKGKEEPHSMPSSFTSISDYKVDKDGKALCWITTKTDETEYYASVSNGPVDKLGSPDFIVFPCTKMVEGKPDICLGRNWTEASLLRLNKIALDIISFCGEEYFSFDDHLKLTSLEAEYLYPEKTTDDCRKKAAALFMPLHNEIRNAFQSDGKEKFCSWARHSYDKHDDQFFDRFKK